jgi:hypothetical protein
MYKKQPFVILPPFTQGIMADTVASPGVKDTGFFDEKLTHEAAVEYDGEHPVFPLV